MGSAGMTPTSPSKTAIFETPEKLDYPVQATGEYRGNRRAFVNTLLSGNNDNSSGFFTQRATDSSPENKTRNPVNDFSSRRFSSRHSACTVDPFTSTRVGDTRSIGQQWRCSSEQSVDDESPGRNNPVALNSSDNPEDHDATSFRTGAVSKTEEKIFSDHGPGQSFGGSPRFRDARLVEIANQLEDGSHVITVQLRQLLEDKKRQLQSTATGWDRSAENAVSLLDDADASLNTLHLGYFELLKKVENCCTLIDRIPEGRTAEPGVHIQRPEQARQDKEKLSLSHMCQHYRRHCLVRFSCCRDYYPCHLCHNLGIQCGKKNVKAYHATHIKCAECLVEQEINEDSQYCSACQTRFSEYFCAKCKHFTSKHKNPHHCDKCGICRIHSDNSFHCDVCNICLNKKLEGKHNCKANSGHDVCFICLEDTFSGCHILPCSHKVHRDCVNKVAGPNGYLECLFCVSTNHMESYISELLVSNPPVT